MQRYPSIDSMRGITVIFMLIVNHPVDMRITFPLLRHSTWQGLTLADVIFPCFLFIVGISITLSFAGNGYQSKTLKKILLRTLIIFLLGIFSKIVVFFLFDRPDIKLMGVLQRIAICYLVVALMRKHTSNKTIALSLLVILGIWCALLIIWGDYRPFYNLSDTVDNWILHKRANVYDPVSGRYGDYEGILSTLGALATTLLGVIAGEMLLARKLSRLWLGGLICFIAGVLLAQYANIPIIKKIWTPSFLLICAGGAFWFCALCHYLFDINKLPAVTQSIGQHALLIYVASTLAFYILLASRLWLPLFAWSYARSAPFLPSPHWAALLFSLTITLLWWLLAYQLCRNKFRLFI